MVNKKTMVMGIVIAVVVIGALFLIAAITSGVQGKEPNKVSMNVFTRGENTVLVDVRTADEYNGGHIEGALNVDFYDPAFIEKMKALGTDKNFFIYCRSGNRSGQAVAALKNAGFTVDDLKGGIMSHPELLK